MTTSPMSAPKPDQIALRAAFGQFPTGVTLIAIHAEDGPMGFVANSFTSLSLDPPLVLWCPSKTSLRFQRFAAAEHFAVHILSQAQRPLVDRFARGGPGFDGLDPLANAEGVPIVADAVARFDCRRHSTHDGGDHIVIVGRVLRWVSGPGAPLVFSQGRYGQVRDINDAP